MSNPAGTAAVAQAVGLRTAHRRANTARLGLVAGREDDAGAHDDRAVKEARVVALLDGGVEPVEVCVQDRDPA